MRGPLRRSWSPQPPADWYDVFIQPRYPSRIRVQVSDRPAQISGKVMADGKPAPGVPVFLWPVADSARRSLGGFLQAISSVDGRVSFQDLPPGDYRLLATLDVDEIDADLMNLANATTIHAEAMQPANVELTVWIAP
jgi:hypothetical protein